jgi:hypothetical protein
MTNTLPARDRETERAIAFEASQDAGPAWIKVKGMEIDRDGIARREREVLVRRGRDATGAAMCPVLSSANATFARYGRLPRRRPGVTVPDFLRRVA